MLKMLKMESNINGKTVVIFFDYSESCRNVYRTFEVYVDGKKSNRKKLDNLLSLDKEGYPTVLTSNTYFWTSGSNAKDRRYRETKYINEVKDFFELCGFKVID